MNMTGLNVRKISNKLFLENLSQVRKRTFYMQGYFSSYPNDLAIWHSMSMRPLLSPLLSTACRVHWVLNPVCRGAVDGVFAVDGTGADAVLCKWALKLTFGAVDVADTFIKSNESLDLDLKFCNLALAKEILP